MNENISDLKILVGCLQNKPDVLIPDPAQDGTRSLGRSCRPHPRPCYTQALGIKETADKGENRCQPGSQS